MKNVNKNCNKLKNLGLHINGLLTRNLKTQINNVGRYYHREGVFSRHKYLGIKAKVRIRPTDQILKGVILQTNTA